MSIPLFLGGKILLCGRALAKTCCQGQARRIAAVSISLSGNSGVFTAHCLGYDGVIWGYDHTAGAAADVWNGGVMWGTPAASGRFTAWFDLDVLSSPVILQAMAETHYSRKGDQPGTVTITVDYLGQTTTDTLAPSPVYTEAEDYASGWVPSAGPGASAATKTITITVAGVSIA